MTGSLGSKPSGNMLKSVSAVNRVATSETVRPIGPPMSRLSCKGMMPALQNTACWLFWACAVVAKADGVYQNGVSLHTGHVRLAPRMTAVQAYVCRATGNIDIQCAAFHLLREILVFHGRFEQNCRALAHAAEQVASEEVAIH